MSSQGRTAEIDAAVPAAGDAEKRLTRKRRRKRWILWTTVIIIGIPVLGAGIGYLSQLGKTVDAGNAPYEHVPADVSLASLSGHPAFSGFGQMMDPFEPGMASTLTSPLALNKVVGYLSWDANTIVNGINFVIDEVNAGTAAYQPLYSVEEVDAEPSKADAGVLILPGDPGGRTAVVLAGGGWRAQANLQEAFPLARELHDDGYSVAIVRYRIGVHPDDPNRDDDPTNGREAAVQRSQQDLAAAVTVLQSNADEWNITLDDYSIWGSSAGGQLAMNWASDHPLSARALRLPQPAAVIAAYPPDYFWTPQADYPPLYLIAAANDSLVPIADTDQMVAGLETAGHPVQYNRLDTGGHGFGSGTGTAADGWIADAEHFWRDAAAADKETR